MDAFSISEDLRERCTKYNLFTSTTVQQLGGSCVKHKKWFFFSFGTPCLKAFMDPAVAERWILTADACLSHGRLR